MVDGLRKIFKIRKRSSQKVINPGHAYEEEEEVVEEPSREAGKFASGPKLPDPYQGQVQ